MPNLQSLIERGCSAPLASPRPLELEPMFATIATGRLADAHGVLGPHQVRADGGGVEMTGRRSWRFPALWDMLTSEGLSSITVNWPGTASARGFPATHVDNRFAAPSGAGFETWAMPPDSLNPPDLAPSLAGLRIHPADDLAAELALFAPDWRKAEWRPIAVLRTILARALTVHAAAVELAGSRPWDMLCVYYEWLHDIKAAFGHEPADGPLGQAVAQAHVLQDGMLGRLVELAGPGATITIASPNGISAAADGSWRNQPRGILVAAGSGIARDQLLSSLNAADIAPSLLARFGLSAPSDGQVHAALAPLPARRAVRDAEPPPAAEPDPADELLAEGYRDPLTEEQHGAILATERHRASNQAIASMSRGAMAAAIEQLHAILARWPHDRSALLLIGRAMMLAGDPASLRPVGQALLAIDSFDPWGHLTMAAWHALAGDPADAAGPVASARELGDDNAELLVRLAGLEMLRDQPASAADACEAALALEPGMSEALYGLGLARQRLGDPAAAESALRRAVEIEPNMPLAQLQLGTLLLDQGRLQEAAARLRTALDQDLGWPEAERLLNVTRNAILRAVTKP